MFTTKKAKKNNIGPVITMIVLIFAVILMSAIFSAVGVAGNQTYIANGSLETSLITVNNILSRSGIKYIVTNVITNFQSFEPLIILIISLIAISIGESSGLFKATFTPLKKINQKMITFLVLLLGIVSSFFGEFSYLILLPLTAILYQTIGKKPLLGIMTAFLGITIGYGIGFAANNDEIILSLLTSKAVRVDVDKAYGYLLTSNAYISFISSLIIAFVGTIIIHGTLDKKVPKTAIIDDDMENLVISKKALHYSTLAFFIMLVLLIYMIVPGLYGSGLLLGSGTTYAERLIGSNSPFSSGLSFIILVIMMVCGFIYGRVSGNIKNSTEYSVALSKNFEGIGYVFVLLFFTSQLLAILDWTNLGNVIAVNLVSAMGNLTFAGLPLIIMFFIFVIIMSILIPSTETKWGIIAPLIIPLMMRANVTPSFSQFVFRVADGVGKSITPFFAYYIIMLGFLEKYNTKENTKITVFGILKTMMPTVLLFALVSLLIIVCWYLLGVPTGPGVYSTF